MTNNGVIGIAMIVLMLAILMGIAYGERAW